MSWESLNQIPLDNVYTALKPFVNMYMYIGKGLETCLKCVVSEERCPATYILARLDNSNSLQYSTLLY